MRLILSLITWTLVVVLVPVARGQVDQTSRLLLRTGTQTADDYESSSRYTVRPKDRSEDIVRQGEPKRQPKQVKKNFTGNNNSQKVPKSVEEEAEGFRINPVQYQESEDKDLKEELRDTLWGGTSEKIVQYKSLLHHKDTRRNTIEIEIAPGYFYSDSSSKYWFRSHYSHGTKLDLALNAWLTPFFGVRTAFGTSQGASIKAQPGSDTELKVDHKNFVVGFRFRSFFGLSRKAKSLNFGLDFDEYQFNVPSDATQRFSTRSSGLRLSLESVVPSTNSEAWVWGVELLPSRSHEENNSSVDINSGSKNESVGVGMWFGKKIVFDRKNQFFWRISHRSEKNIFEGQADTMDPITNSQPDGVTITNSLTQFHLGFTWGR